MTDLLHISEVAARAIQDARAIPTANVRDWCSIAVQAKARNDTLGPILTPAQYPADAKALDATARIAKAYLAFRETIEETVNR